MTELLYELTGLFLTSSVDRPSFLFGLYSAVTTKNHVFVTHVCPFWQYSVSSPLIPLFFHVGPFFLINLTLFNDVRLGSADSRIIGWTKGLTGIGGLSLVTGTHRPLFVMVALASSEGVGG